MDDLQLTTLFIGLVVTGGIIFGCLVKYNLDKKSKQKKIPSKKQRRELNL